MANGQTLDDSRLTLAMTPTDVRTHTLLNKHVIVKNIKTNAHVVATVTDTGGFARHNRIADLSVATKQAIGCSDLCEVEITVE
jgi:rare lipoprotein A (peptidoglycan hydrolase)